MDLQLLFGLLLSALIGLSLGLIGGGTKAWMDAGLDTEVSATSCANS